MEYWVRVPRTPSQLQNATGLPLDMPCGYTRLLATYVVAKAASKPSRPPSPESRVAQLVARGSKE
eukprot:scaffold470347_cov17-Prasinocladus_malaysianus.AAC.1